MLVNRVMLYAPSAKGCPSIRSNRAEERGKSGVVPVTLRLSRAVTSHGRGRDGKRGSVELKNFRGPPSALESFRANGNCRKYLHSPRNGSPERNWQGSSESFVVPPRTIIVLPPHLRARHACTPKTSRVCPKGRSRTALVESLQFQICVHCKITSRFYTDQPGFHDRCCRCAEPVEISTKPCRIKSIYISLQRTCRT